MKQIIIVGGQRSGSTFFLEKFDNLAEAKTTSKKNPEPKYFLDQNYLGREAYIKSVFGNVSPSTQLLVEKSTSYYEHENALRKIAADFPEALILFLIRDPIDRAVSNFWFSVENKLESREINEALMAQDVVSNISDISVSPFAYRARSKYSVHIKKLQGIFSPDKLHFLIFEELVEDQQIFASLIRKLGFNYESVQGWKSAKNASIKGTEKLSDMTIKILKNEFHNDYLAVKDLIKRDPKNWRSYCI